MNKIKSYLVAAGILAMPFVAVVPSSASALNCSITNTGAGSTNTCVQNGTYTCTVTNNNAIVINDANNQQVFSGNANVTGNGAGGSAQTGTATNTNGVAFDVVISNGNCVAGAAVTPTPTTPTPVTPTPSTPAQTTPVVTAPNKIKPSALANTNGSNVAMIVAAIMATGLATFGAVRIARRFQ